MSILGHRVKRKEDPHLITGGGYTTRLVLINLTGSGSTGTILFLTADGSIAAF